VVWLLVDVMEVVEAVDVAAVVEVAELELDGGSVLTLDVVVDVAPVNAVVVLLLPDTVLLCPGVCMTWSPTVAIAAMARIPRIPAAYIVFISCTSVLGEEKGPRETGVPSQNGTVFHAWNLPRSEVHVERGCLTDIWKVGITSP